MNDLQKSWGGGNTKYIEDILYFDRNLVDSSQARQYGLCWCKDYNDVNAVQVNAVCKIQSASWDEVSRCRDFIKEFDFILVAVPSGEKRDEIVNEILARFKAIVCVPNDDAWYGCKSLEELRNKGGLSAIEGLFYGCKEIPINGILDVSKITDDEQISRNRTFSGIPSLDKAIGGFSGGEMSVWTAKRGEGKSTLISQMIPEAVAIGKQVCVYSGEMRATAFRQILYRQIAGTRNICKKIDSFTGKELYFTSESAVKKIDSWIRDRVFIVDIKTANAHDEDNIISLFEYAYRRKHCRVFVVDNIMTTELKNEAKLGQWRAQSLFASRLVAFAQRFDVHVHLVAHPRKTKESKFDSDDVGGSGDITNKADNVFQLSRVADENVDEAGCSAAIRILKNRMYGERSTVKLDFDPISKRFYPAGGTPYRKFDWEMM